MGLPGIVLAGINDKIKIKSEKRPLVKKLLEDWLVKEATTNPGEWVNDMRKDLDSLANTLDLHYTGTSLEMVCASRDQRTLTKLRNGSLYFYKYRNLTEDLVRLIKD